MASKGGKPTSYTVGDFAVEAVRSRVRHNNLVAAAFLLDPATFLTLAEGQRCAVFNLSMALAGVGLTMPSEGVGRNRRNRWDAATFDRGTALAKGRDLVPSQWAHQRYSPLAIPGQNRRKAVQALMVEAAQAGLIAGVKPEDVASDEQATTWYVATMEKLTADETSPLIQRPTRGGYVVAVRADLPKDRATARRAPADKGSILADLHGE